MRTPILLLFILISSRAFCQEQFKKGYIVNNNSDTVRGYIKEDLDERLTKSVAFRDVNSVDTVLSIPDIKAFGFDQGSLYRRISYAQPLDSGKRQTHFAKLLMQGACQLFSFIKKDILYFVVNTGDSAYLLYDDQTSQTGEMKEEGNYRNFLAFFARECPNVNATAGKVNYNEQAFISYFTSLEKCKGTFSNAQITYHKPKTERYILVTAGALAIDKKSEVFMQALMQFYWPNFSKRTSLNTGLTFSRNSTETSTPYSFGEVKDQLVTQLYELPLIVRHNILSKGVRPYIYGGVAIGVKQEIETVSKVSSFETESFKTNHTSFGATVLLGGGIDVGVWKSFLLNVDWHYDLLSHLPVLGIGYRSNKF